MEKVADFTKAETSSSTEPDIAVSSQHTEVVPDDNRSEVVPDDNRSADNALLSCSKSSPVATSEPSSLKQSIRPLAPLGAPFIFNRYKLDNRSTSFKINPPIPSGLANVIFLHSPFGH